MQFVTDGPDIPDGLLRAHEEGRVVFFCGAGIAYPAGLPGFKGLVTDIYAEIGTHPTAIEKAAFDLSQFDATLDLLERRLPGKRHQVRSALAKVLKPKLRRKGAYDSHAALLELAKARDGSTRLVTTNFDTVFQWYIKRKKLNVPFYSAPQLPIPKNSRWNGLVYLHGLLPNNLDSAALNRLVFTSGDFGLAYLTERWAARFVSELFRNYTVCFVGYSLNDPVLRYMMDALAADRLQGETTSPIAYAFGQYEPGNEALALVEWQAKVEEPILYQVRGNSHSALHDTLKAWAATYRDGVQGKEQIVVSYAGTRPMMSTPQDNFVGRMLWALCEPTGASARRFATFNPVPSLEWLGPLSEERYKHDDLLRFGVSPTQIEDKKLAFSHIKRPAPYSLSPPMTLFAGFDSGSEWDHVLRAIAAWLVRHLDDPKLIWLIGAQGGHLNPRLANAISNALDYIEQLERDGKSKVLADLQENAPNCVPRKAMRTIWRILLRPRIARPVYGDFYKWRRRFLRDGATASLRLELRGLLSPKVEFRRPIGAKEEDNRSEEIAKLVDWEVTPSASHMRSSLLEIRLSQEWKSVLPSLIHEFEQLLIDTLDLMAELGEAREDYDRSFWDIPSISVHWQNRGFRNWVCLVEVLRDGFDQVASAEPAQASSMAVRWWSVAYLTFKRLALYAAANTNLPGEIWLNWLLSDEHRWLWLAQTQREVTRLLVQRGGALAEEQRDRLIDAIVAGPPRSLLLPEVSNEEAEKYHERAVWLRLAKLESANIPLTEGVKSKLQRLTDNHPAWKLSSTEREEFPHWMSGSGDPDYEDDRQVALAPEDREELLKWLTTQTSDGFWITDNWRDICRKDLRLGAWALLTLARAGTWPINRWSEALQAWAEEAFRVRSWRYISAAMLSMSEDTLSALSQSASYWLRGMPKALGGCNQLLFEICRKFTSLSYPVETRITAPVDAAINHPLGNIAQTVLDCWLLSGPKDKDGLSGNIVEVFNILTNGAVPHFRHARVLLAANVIALFRVDERWTRERLLPYFDWDQTSEAGAAWEGFLWSPRVHHPLLAALKSDFLATARHYAELGRHGRQYAALLTYVGLDRADTFSPLELHSATRSMPYEGLEPVADTLSRSLLGAGEQRAEFWKNRVLPYWKEIWPKENQLVTPKISEAFAMLVAGSGEVFLEALSTMQDWIQPIEHPYMVIKTLLDSGATKTYPRAALDLLARVIRDQPWPDENLVVCLDNIAEALPALVSDPKYILLRTYLRVRLQ